MRRESASSAAERVAASAVTCAVVKSFASCLAVRIRAVTVLPTVPSTVASPIRAASCASACAIAAA